MSSNIPAAETRAAPTLSGHDHPLFRQAAASSYKFEVAAGNNAAPTSTIIGDFKAKYAGVYAVLLETGDDTTHGLFRLDDGGTVTFIQDAGADFANTPTNAKVAIYNNSGVLTINNRFGAASTAVAVAVTIAFLYRA